jgi:hypothetical protein
MFNFLKIHNADGVLKLQILSDYFFIGLFPALNKLTRLIWLRDANLYIASRVPPASLFTQKPPEFLPEAWRWLNYEVQPRPSSPSTNPRPTRLGDENNVVRSKVLGARDKYEFEYTDPLTTNNYELSYPLLLIPYPY